MCIRDREMTLMTQHLKKLLPVRSRLWRDGAATAVFLSLATAVNALGTHMPGVPSSVPQLYILAVLLTALRTAGYFWGLLCAVLGVIGTNYFFTYPYFAFDFTLSGYPLKMCIRDRISHIPQDTSFLRGSLDDFIAARSLDGSLLRAILRKLDFTRAQFSRDLADYSGGQKKKVLLAAALARPAHLLVWDEPLNFIDILSREQIEALLLLSLIHISSHPSAP